MADSPPPDDDARPSLPTELHVATREEHLSLNRLILARLPLCLPPHSVSPFLYACGLTVFSQIYTSFEQEWDSLLCHLDEGDRIHTLLTHIRTPGLHRSKRLQTDLTALKRLLPHPAHHAALAHLNTLSQLVAHNIQTTIHHHPPSLLAYAWTMYLALFNGGRWIRAQLYTAGDSFWAPDTPPYPLSFWDFEGADNGEAIKAAFKRDFGAAASALTREESAEVVAEAKRLFALCADLVGLLDRTVAEFARVGGCGLDLAAADRQRGVMVPDQDRKRALSQNRDAAWLITLAYIAIARHLAGVWGFVLSTCTAGRSLAFAARKTRESHAESVK